jgi:low affinity Fe/Cu permease
MIPRQWYVFLGLFILGISIVVTIIGILIFNYFLTPKTQNEDIKLINQKLDRLFGAWTPE